MNKFIQVPKLLTSYTGKRIFSGYALNKLTFVMSVKIWTREKNTYIILFVTAYVGTDIALNKS